MGWARRDYFIHQWEIVFSLAITQLRILRSLEDEPASIALMKSSREIDCQGLYRRFSRSLRVVTLYDFVYDFRLI